MQLSGECLGKVSEAMSPSIEAFRRGGRKRTGPHHTVTKASLGDQDICSPELQGTSRRWVGRQSGEKTFLSSAEGI